jgi:hypothetical protein
MLIVYEQQYCCFVYRQVGSNSAICMPRTGLSINHIDKKTVLGWLYDRLILDCQNKMVEIR